MKRFLKIAVIAAVVALLVIAAVRAVKHKKGQEEAMPPAREYAVVVKTVTPQIEEVTLTVPYIATVQNDNDTVVASKLAARVESIKRSSSRVKKGEIVVTLDTTDLKAKLSAVKAQIRAAKEAVSARKTALSTLQAAHARTKKLLNVKGASQEQFDAEESKIAATRASIAETEAKIEALAANEREIANLMSYARIEAPVDGIVGKSFVNSGDMAMPGKPLLSISAQSGAYLLLRIPDNIKPKYLIYKKKMLKLYPLDRTFNGLKEYRTKKLDAKAVTNERVDVDVVLFRGRALMLPTDAVLNRDGRSVVIVAEKGRAKAVPVTIEANGEQGIIVSQNTLAGKPVVVAKPDILLNLLSGAEIKTRREDEHR